MYHDASRSLQDRFDTRRLADRIGRKKLLRIAQQHALERVSETFDTAKRGDADSHGQNDKYELRGCGAKVPPGDFRCRP